MNLDYAEALDRLADDHAAAGTCDGDFRCRVCDVLRGAAVQLRSAHAALAQPVLPFGTEPVVLTP